MLTGFGEIIVGFFSAAIVGAKLGLEIAGVIVGEGRLRLVFGAETSEVSAGWRIPAAIGGGMSSSGIALPVRATFSCCCKVYI